jgi:hypothetical protein
MLEWASWPLQSDTARLSVSFGRRLVAALKKKTDVDALGPQEEKGQP